MLAGLPRKNTDALIGGVARVLKDEGIHLHDSTALLKPLLAPVGVMTRRKPTRDEHDDRNMVSRSLARWLDGMSDKAWLYLGGRAWRSRLWRVPMPCCAARHRW